MKWGHGYGSATTGDLNARGFGIKLVNRSTALKLCVHDGTTYGETTSSYTPAQYEIFDWDIISDGGTVTLYVNGSSVASTSTYVPSGTVNGEWGWQTENTTVTSYVASSGLDEYAGGYYVAP